jgi:GTP-binding protein
MTQLRNLCIIAHVDHGKTTLVDHLLRQAGTFQAHQALTERVMDSGDLEREKGITILAKNTSIRLGDVKLNIVDTPGHADFGGEVERILGMVDGALLLVDAAEGPLPQTRFVLQKALSQGLKIILVINKVDRPECVDGKRIQEVVNAAFDLFVELGANDEQLDFPIVYAVARNGWCTTKSEDISALLAGTKKETLKPLFDLMVNFLPAPRIEEGSDLKVLISNLSYSDYMGRLSVGRILSGSVVRNQTLYALGEDANGKPTKERFQAARLYTFEGLQQVETERLEAGDIGVFSGTEKVEIGDTLVSNESTPALARIRVEKPTLAMVFSVNTSPLSGQEGEAVQSRKLRERLQKEVRTNVALRLEDTAFPDQFRVLGRGELQFAILIEQMRREGLEFMIGKPVVLMQSDESGNRLEPIELAVMDLPQDHVGDVTQLFQGRKGILQKYEPFENPHAANAVQRVRLEFEIPTRGLLGLRSKFMTLTRGTGIMSSHVQGYQPFRGQIMHRMNGALIADRAGETVEYALLNLEERGVLFMGPGHPVYEGLIIGEHSLDNDMNVNPCKEKKLTNIRAASAEFLVTLAGIRKMSLEQCIEWIDEDEWIEVTPESVRLRKKVLQQNQRSVKRADRIGL